MTDTTILVRWQMRRGTAAALAAANETTKPGEYYLEVDTGRTKLGDGSPYNSIAYKADATPAFTFQADTSSTADSDPGNGKFKWNNATQASATVLYFDNQTFDTATSMTTFFGTTPGFIHIVNAGNAKQWQVWKVSAAVAGSGYYKFTVTLSASSSTIATGTACRVTFIGGGGFSFTTNNRVLGRKTAGAGAGEECTLSEVLDFIGSAAQGDLLYRGASAWARLPAGTSGQFLKTLGTGTNPAWATPSVTEGTVVAFDAHSQATRHDEFEDWVSCGWVSAVSAGSIGNYTASIIPGRPGILKASTGSSSSGIGGATDAVNNWMALGGGACWVEHSFQLPTLSDATNRYSLTAGWRDVGASAPANQLVLSYTDNVNSGNWVLRSIVGGVTTDVNASSGPSAGSWYRLRIEVNAAGTSAEFFINGTSIGTTTAIPTAAMRRALLVVKSVGVTERFALWDFSTYDNTFTTPR